MDAVDGVAHILANVTPHIAHDTISIHAFMQTTCCSATDSVSKVRRLIVGLETLRFCTGNDEKCCTLVYIMSPEIICPNLAVKESEPTVCYFLHILSSQLFSETTSHFVNAINCFLLASSLTLPTRTFRRSSDAN